MTIDCERRAEKRKSPLELSQHPKRSQRDSFWRILKKEEMGKLNAMETAHFQKFHLVISFKRDILKII